MLWFNAPYETMTFCEVWPDVNEFISDWTDLGAPMGFVGAPNDALLRRTYFMLIARYGNNPIANTDVGQFKLKVFSIIGAYSANYEKKEEIQDTLRNLTEDQLLAGAKQIYNHALNPNTEPSTSALEELEYINDQNTASHKKSVMEAYSILWSLLHADHTREYLDRFKKCFAVFVDKMPAPFYIREEDYIA